MEAELCWSMVIKWLSCGDLHVLACSFVLLHVFRQEMVVVRFMTSVHVSDVVNLLWLRGAPFHHQPNWEVAQDSILPPLLLALPPPIPIGCLVSRSQLLTPHWLIL